jgi:hypothetical protein
MIKNYRIDEIREEHKFIDEYLNELLPDQIESTFEFWKNKAEEISELLGNKVVNTLILAANADILYKKREEDLALLIHSKNTSNNYSGALDLSVFLSKYLNNDAVPLRIVIDYKTRFIKGDKNNPRDKEDLKTIGASSVTIEGKNLLNLLIKEFCKTQIQDFAHVFGSYERQPLFAANIFPNNKAKFIAKHNKIAAVQIFSFFSPYTEVTARQKKIYTMKVLVFINFLDSYEKYKELKTKKNVKKVLAENEYYLQRFSDLTKSR